MTVWYADTYRTAIHTCIPDGHLHRVTYARCRIDIIDSPDDEHLVVSKHVECRNKHTRKRTVRRVGYLQEFYRKLGGLRGISGGCGKFRLHRDSISGQSSSSASRYTAIV